MSKTSPSWSTARHRYIRLPAIRTTISSRCHRSLGRGRHRRSFRAIPGPNFRTQRRTVIGNIQAALGEELLDVAVAQCEPEIKPDRVLDDRRREAMPSVGELIHAGSLPHGLAPSNSVSVTMP